MNCDICGRDRSGTLLTNQTLRDAVFSKGFDPFSLGLISQTTQLQWADNALWGSSDPLANWKKNLVAINQSDWFICSKCRKKLSPYLDQASQSSFREYTAQKEWNDEKLAVILAIFICPVFGMYMLWKTRTFSRRAKVIILIVYAAILTIAGYIHYLDEVTK